MQKKWKFPFKMESIGDTLKANILNSQQKWECIICFLSTVCKEDKSIQTTFFFWQVTSLSRWPHSSSVSQVKQQD